MPQFLQACLELIQAALQRSQVRYGRLFGYRLLHCGKLDFHGPANRIEIGRGDRIGAIQCVLYLLVQLTQPVLQQCGLRLQRVRLHVLVQARQGNMIDDHGSADKQQPGRRGDIQQPTATGW
ncbi:hypothetical protein A11A3_16742 [Alcanivorax hongdengensis A-11-3]|uniref:Uncharacterized protein n=1 Tax=Alcanivorax hongdengensis A-11-3 TaxID=1177179 RepID=L0W7B6_9GAMM|nr:hypothetical protein A11A3_16742 [Alcanivorax hongdengensis A-11-3]